MAKITIQRIFETTKALATEAGQSLQDFINFSAQFSEITIRALRNGLNYADNFDCEITNLSLTQTTPLIIASRSKRPTEIRIRRILTQGVKLSAPLAWGFTASGRIYLEATFTPAPTQPIDVEVIILY